MHSLYPQKSINGNVSGSLVINGNLTVTGLTTTATLATTGLATLNSLAVTTNETVGGTLGVTGAVTMASTLGVTGAASFLSVTTGAVTATGLVSANAGLTIVGTLTLPAASQLKYQIVELYMSSILGADSIVSVVNPQITGTIESISVVTNAVLAVGSAIFTCAIVAAGVSTNITNGAPTVLTSTGVFIPITVTPSGNNVISATTSVLKCQVGGTNTQVGNATVAFKILVA